MDTLYLNKDTEKSQKPFEFTFNYLIKTLTNRLLLYLILTLNVYKK